MSALRQAAPPVAVWALMNGVLAAILVFFPGHTHPLELEIFWSAVGLLVAVALLVATSRHTPDPRGHEQAVTGAPSLAFAAACLFGVLAWVFGVWLAYLALPPMAFVIGRLRAERQGRRT